MKKEAGFSPDVISWTTLIKAHANAGNFSAAFDLLHTMTHEGKVR